MNHVGAIDVVDYTWAMFDEDVDRLVADLRAADLTITRVYGVPRGGIIPAAAIAWRIGAPCVTSLRDLNDRTVLWVDDNCITGFAMAGAKTVLAPTAVLVYHPFAGTPAPTFVGRTLDTLPRFPWERD